jgi:hypothetical protein
MAFAALLLATALNPSIMVGLLDGLGVVPRAARLAGAQLSVVVGFVGGGMLLIGLSTLARAGRLSQAWAAHAQALQQVAQPMGARLQTVEGVGVGFATEVRGLRLEVVLDPDRRGGLWVRAQCAAQQVLEIWPLGMPPESPAGGWRQVEAGRSWELWAPVMLDGAGPVLSAGLRDALDAVFTSGGASRLRHDAGGIEVELPHARELDPQDRVPLAIDAVVALARCNH